MVESIDQTTGIQLYVAGLFPTPVAIINFGEQARELNTRLVEDIDDAKENNLSEERTFSNNSAGWQSSAGLEKHYHSFVSLKNLIHQVAIPAMEWTGYDKEYLQTSVEITGLWANLIDGPGGWSSPHVHGYGDTLWSGVYYPTSGIQDGESASADLDLDDFKINDTEIDNTETNINSIDSNEIIQNTISDIDYRELLDQTRQELEKYKLSSEEKEEKLNNLNKRFSDFINEI